MADVLAPEKPDTTSAAIQCADHGGGSAASRTPVVEASETATFTIAHIASPLVRHCLPGQAPFPSARARESIHLLKAALDRAKEEGADAIALTGSVASAPPPLRQCDKGGYYKNPDAAAAFEEASADYMQVRTLLEESGLHYTVTPGAEDCMEAFESIFGLEPSAKILVAQAAGMTSKAAEERRRRQQARKIEDEGSGDAGDAIAEVEPYEDPKAISMRAISDFKARLKKAQDPSGRSAASASTDPVKSTMPMPTAIGLLPSSGSGRAHSADADSPSRLKGGGVDLEDIGESCCAGTSASARGTCCSSSGGGGGGDGGGGNEDDHVDNDEKGGAEWGDFLRSASSGGGGTAGWEQKPTQVPRDMGSFISGQDTPEGETPQKCLLVRLPDHVPPYGLPQRLEYERRVVDWALCPESKSTPQCHIQTFAPVAFSLPAGMPAGSEPDRATTAQRVQSESVDATGEGVGMTTKVSRTGKQEDGASPVDGAVFYEHESLRASLEASGKMVLSLYSLGVQQSEYGVAWHGSREGRVTYAGAPSLAIPPHRFAIHRLRAVNHSLTMDPRVSRSAEEVRAKADLVRHRHFWGHQEIALGNDLDAGVSLWARNPVPEPQISLPALKDKIPVVFLDRDGVISTLPSYNTGPAGMKLIPGAAYAIVRLQQAGCKVVVVSSQACVGKGFVRTSDVNSVMDRMCRLLRQEAQDHLAQLPKTGFLPSESLNDLAQPDAIIFSVGAGAKAIHEDYRDTSDAKPSPSSLLKGAACLGVESCRRLGFMVGDRVSDLSAGAAADCRLLLVKTGMGAEASRQLAEPGGGGAARGSIMENLIGEVPDLAAAADVILSSLGGSC